jgi:hypothetical protein
MCYGVSVRRLQPSPGAREKESRKDPMCPYLDLTQVPQARNLRRVGSNSVKGIRQNSSVSSVEGVPALKEAGRSDKGAPTV